MLASALSPIAVPARGGRARDRELALRVHGLHAGRRDQHRQVDRRRPSPSSTGRARPRAPATCGANPSSANAATLSRSVCPRSAPARIALIDRRAAASRFGPPLRLGDRLEPRHQTGDSSHARAHDAHARVVLRRLRAARRAAPLAVAEHALGIGPGERQPGEELRRHAAAAAGVVHRRSSTARAGRLRLAQRQEQLRLAPHGREARPRARCRRGTSRGSRTGTRRRRRPGRSGTRPAPRRTGSAPAAICP